MGRSQLFSTTALAGLLAGSSAFGADLAPVPYKESQKLQWSGFYVGANVGYAWASDPTMTCTSIAVGFASPCVAPPFSPPRQFSAPNPAGAEYGLQAGYNWQVSNFVLGLEADFNKLDARGSSQFPGIDPGKGLDQASSRYDWLGTARGRVGVTNGPALFYATGGFAYGRVNHEYIQGVNDPRRQVFSLSENRTGWTVGGGAEYALSQHWSLRAEYLYVNLGNSHLDISTVIFGGNGGGPAPLPGTSFQHFNNNLNIVRLGANYRF
jgi:outer membrane immunogenic protein